MFWIFIQLYDLIVNHRFTILVIVWLVGMFNFILISYYYKQYKPYRNEYRIPVTVVVPTFREDPKLFVKCLESIKNQLEKFDEFFIVFDGEDRDLQEIAKPYGKIMVKEHGGKRSTLSYGCDRAHNKIIITIDSDTILQKDTIKNICMPFINKEIGAVSAYQRIFDSNSNITSKFADYNELMSHGFIQKATSAAGNVAVLYGRCLSIRKEVWDKISIKYQTKTFLGRKVESGDDNDITLLTISEGYKTFMQETAKVTSDCPRSFWKRLKQQYRFSRSSMRVTLSDWLSNPKLIKRAKLGFLNQMEAVIFPLLILLVWSEWIYHTLYGYNNLITFDNVFVMIILSFLTLFITLAFHNFHLIEKNDDIFIWILYLFYSWSVINILHIISIITIFQEKPNMMQYSRNK